MTTFRSGFTALVWLIVVAVIALGAAGIVTGMDQSSPVARPELTAAGDAKVSAALDAAEVDLVALADDITALSVQARGALAALNGTDIATVEAAVQRGDALVQRIGERSTAVRLALADVPLIGTNEGDYEVSDAVRARHERLVAAADATTALDLAWQRLTVFSLAASRLSARLTAHDEAVLKAASLGRSGKYQEAAAALDAADAAIAESRRQRDQLAKTVDVTTLDAWLDRNAAYDTALRDLYVALRGVKGRVTSEVRKAIEAEQAAKERLPPDARGLVLIMSDIGRGGMNEAVIAIEEARGRLSDALAGSDTGASPAPVVSPVPDASGESPASPVPGAPTPPD